MEPSASADAVPRWTIARTAGYGALVMLVFLSAQTAAVLGVIIARLLNDPRFDLRELAAAGADGKLLAAATFVSTAACVPFITYLAGRRERAPWRFLGFVSVNATTLAIWSAAVLALAAIGDLLTVLLGRPIVVDFMVDAYASAPPVLLGAALIVAAPLFEEIYFRGLLLGALEASGVPWLAAAAVVSTLWAGIHFQYDPYGVGIIFVGGLLLAAARKITGSIVPCIVMHGLQNAYALAETAYVAGRGAGGA